MACRCKRLISTALYGIQVLTILAVLSARDKQSMHDVTGTMRVDVASGCWWWWWWSTTEIHHRIQARTFIHVRLLTIARIERIECVYFACMYVCMYVVYIGFKSKSKYVFFFPIAICIYIYKVISYPPGMWHVACEYGKLPRMEWRVR